MKRGWDFGLSSEGSGSLSYKVANNQGKKLRGGKTSL
jgi:hypothetical protein